MARYGYARISTRSQRDDSQLDALRAVGCERIWTDTASGKLARRPEWDNCLDHLRAGDELAVTRLSRMARSVRHLTETAALLADRGIDLVVLKQGIDTTTPAGRFTFHVLAAMDEMLAGLISEGTRQGLESARARGRACGRQPKLTTRQAEVARGMYDETGADGRRKYTVAEIAETFGVSRETVCRHLGPSGGRRQPGKTTPPAAPAGPLATLPHPIDARISEPAARARAPLACPACGDEPATRGEALQQREDLAIVWLHLDGDHLTEARHCVACQPHGPVIDVSCSGCGDGPLITGQPPEPGDRLAAPALDWLHSRGSQLHPRPLCPGAVPKTRQITRWLLTRPDHLQADEQAELQAIRARCPHIDALAGHVTAFAEMMTARTGRRDLEAWLAAVEADDRAGLRSFAAGIRNDQQAVTNGLTLHWNSGRVEGTVNMSR